MGVGPWSDDVMWVQSELILGTTAVGYRGQAEGGFLLCSIWTAVPLSYSFTHYSIDPLLIFCRTWLKSAIQIPTFQWQWGFTEKNNACSAPKASESYTLKQCQVNTYTQPKKWSGKQVISVVLVFVIGQLIYKTLAQIVRTCRYNVKYI